MMELIQSKVSVELTKEQCIIIEQLCDGAWKTGGVRSPKDGAILENLRAVIQSAFSMETDKKEAM